MSLNKCLAVLFHFIAVLLLVSVAACGNGDVKVEWWGEMLITFAGTAGAALLALAGRALDKWTKSLAEKTNLEFIARLDELALGVVQDIYSAEVEALKKASADGKLTKEERRHLKTVAVDRLKGIFSLRDLGKVFGGSVQSGLEATVEKAVSRSQAVGKMAKAAAVNP